MIEAEENKEYLPIDGLADFKKATLQLLLGSGHAAIKEVRRPFEACTFSSSTNAALLCGIIGWLNQTSAELSECKMLATCKRYAWHLCLFYKLSLMHSHFWAISMLDSLL
jgi:hypothetical protein